MPVDKAHRCGPEFLALLDGVDEGVLLFDAGGLVRAANVRLAQLFEVDPAALQECTDLDSLIRLIRPQLANADESLARWRELHAHHGEAAWDELELSSPPRALQRFARPVSTPAGQLSGWLELYRDVTSERLFQSRLAQTDKMAALGQLVSGIAHELNNPLTSIMGYTQLLLARQKGAAISGGSRRDSADMQKIFNQAERARRIVKNLLIFAREAEPQRLSVNLNEIVERTLALRSYELRVENIAVELDLAADLPSTMADPHQLQQVILNLIVNAEHALQQHDGPRRISIRTRLHLPNRLAVEVADNGPGVAAEISTRIFEPFFTTKPAGVGTGLGLSIAYGIVKEHGGSISVERRRQPGACFVVELPLVAPPAESAVQVQAGQPYRVVGTLAAGRHILVVEDEPTVAQLIHDVMAEDGHHVEIFDDSQRALQRVLQAQPPIDLIICDLKMPRLDGQAFYRALAERMHLASQRLLFVTGDTLSPRTQAFLESSQVPFLAKPFLVEELKLAVEQRWQASPLGGESLTTRLPAQRRRKPAPPDAIVQPARGASQRQQK